MPSKLDSAKSNRAYMPGSNASGNLSLTQVVNPTATNRYALVGVLWTGGVSVAAAAFTVTFGGTSMTKLDELLWDSNEDRMLLFGLASPPTGQSTVTCSYTGAGTELITRNLMMASVVYSNVESVSAVVKNSGGNTVNNTLTLTGSYAAQRAIAIHGVGKLNSFHSAYTGTRRVFNPIAFGGALLFGDKPADGSTVLTATHLAATSDWGAIGLVLSPTAVESGASVVRTAAPRIVAAGSAYRVTWPAPDRFWEIPADPLATQEDL